MRPLVLARFVLAAMLAAPPTFALAGPAFTASLGGGAELGLDEGEHAGMGEFELTAGWDFGDDYGFRPEVALLAGLEPDTHAGVRAGFRYIFRESPFQLRVALDWSSARNEDFFFRRFVLIGVAAEARLTDSFGLFAELDSGIPLRDSAGVPLMLRGGASLRFF